MSQRSLGAVAIILFALMVLVAMASLDNLPKRGGFLLAAHEYASHGIRKTTDDRYRGLAVEGNRDMKALRA